MKQIFKGKMRLASKVRILNSCVIPTLAYGAKTWLLTKKTSSKLTSNAKEHGKVHIEVKKNGQNQELSGQRADRCEGYTLNNRDNENQIRGTFGKIEERYVGEEDYRMDTIRK